jgi:hypothetical protein
MTPVRGLASAPSPFDRPSFPFDSDGTFDATGGWFARKEQSGAGLRIAGCTWCGSVLLTRILAASGLFLEFGNHVRTTRICEVRHLRPEPMSTVH